MRKVALISAAVVGTAVGGTVLTRFFKDYQFYKTIDQIRSATAALAEKQKAEESEAASSQTT